MPYQKTTYALIVMLLIVLISLAGYAEAHERRGGRRGPPPKSIEACASLIAGDSCTFTGRRDNEITGTCRTPQGTELGCIPANRGGRNGKNCPQSPA
ncbi:MAG: hypothetical protein QGH93_06245, partial [Gammaproteobacteria bacterium]|nr:hypothetical protein [Gammaproteobacteria bacterium]